MEKWQYVKDAEKFLDWLPLFQGDGIRIFLHSFFFFNHSWNIWSILKSFCIDPLFFWRWMGWELFSFPPLNNSWNNNNMWGCWKVLILISFPKIYPNYQPFSKTLIFHFSLLYFHISIFFNYSYFYFFNVFLLGLRTFQHTLKGNQRLY